MSDIAIAWIALQARGDWSVADGGLVTGSDLETAVLVSLFTDKDVPPDQASPDGSTDPRGWWGNTYLDRPIGSLLWTLQRRAISDRAAFLAEAQQICQDALQWLVDDQVAAAVDVTTSFGAPGKLGIQIVVTQPNGKPQSFRYDWVWQGVGQ